jgi:hypothetical protein
MSALLYSGILLVSFYTKQRSIHTVDDRYKLPTGTQRLGRGAALQEGRHVILYARAKTGELDRLIIRLRRFAKAAGLGVNEEYVEEGKPAEAYAAALRHLTQDTSHECGLLIADLDALGANQREVRSQVAALRELDVTIYEAESGAIINWVSLREEDHANA